MATFQPNDPSTINILRRRVATFHAMIINSSLPNSMLLRLLPVIALLVPLLLPSGCARREVRDIPRSGYIVPVDDISARKALQQFYHNWQGIPYQVGGMSPAGVDCSGLVAIAYHDIFGMKLPRTAAEQARFGRKIPLNRLHPGDLLLFKTGMFQDHVGIFFEKNRFIHASSAKGVMISALNEPYWQDSLVKATRLYDYTHTAAR
jgi:hypothetical protein